MTIDHPITQAARLACAALTMAIDTERRAADEVEARGDERRARTMLTNDRDSAAVALKRLSVLIPSRTGDELWQMASAVRDGYARKKWTLRIMQIAAEVMRETK